MRCGHLRQGMAALRNMVMGLRRGAGHLTMVAAGRRFAAQPRVALHLIGIALENGMTLQTFYHTCVRAHPALRREEETSRQYVTHGVLGTRDSEGPVRSLWQAPSLTLSATKEEPYG